VLVNGAFVPPREVLEEVVAVVRAGRREHNVEATPRRGLLRRRAAEVVVPVGPPILVDLPVESLRLPITSFGNLIANDARRLVGELSDAAAGWDRPTVHFTGGSALESPGDRAVWALLDGDIVSLAEIAQGVTSCVERLGLFVDRRIFRPMIAVATVTESTTGPDLEAVVSALQELHGQPWQVDAVVLTVDPTGTGSAQEYQRIPIGSTP
jgi:2'-5' RNA ligase